MKKLTSDRNDPYGFIKLFMAISISLMHYFVLVGDPIDEIDSSNDFAHVLLRLFIDFSKKAGGKLPIGFFILSGMVICKAYYFRIYNEEISFRDFIHRRIRRLFPTMVVSIIVWEIAQFTYYYMNDSWWTNRDSSLWNVIVACTGLSVGTFINAIDTVNGPIWYISVLLVCYTIWFGLVTLEKRKMSDGEDGVCVLYAIPIMVGLSIHYYGINLPFLNESVSVGYVGFFVGVILCRLINENRNGILSDTVPLVISSCIVLAFVIGFVLLRDDLWVILGNTSYLFAFILFPSIILIMERIEESRFLNTKLNGFLGECSFFYYLFHMPVFASIATFNYISKYRCNFYVSIIMSFVVSMIAYGFRRVRKSKL